MTLPDDDALAEIRHELGNRFQRLYFWADQTGGKRSGQEDPVLKLSEELAGLQRYFGSALEYFTEPPLAVVEVPLADLVARLRATLPERKLEVTGLDPLASVGALVDPALLSRVLELVGSRVEAATPQGSVLFLAVRKGSRPKSVELELSGEPDGDAPSPVLSGIEAMVARRWMVRHGGDLSEGSSQPASIIVTVPVD